MNTLEASIAKSPKQIVHRPFINARGASQLCSHLGQTGPSNWSYSPTLGICSDKARVRVESCGIGRECAVEIFRSKSLDKAINRLETGKTEIPRN